MWCVPKQRGHDLKEKLDATPGKSKKLLDLYLSEQEGAAVQVTDAELLR